MSDLEARARRAQVFVPNGAQMALADLVADVDWRPRVKTCDGHHRERRGCNVGLIDETGGTGMPPPEDHLGTSVTTWHGTVPSRQISDLVQGLSGRVRPARWRLEGHERDGLASVQVTMHVYWRQPSHRSVRQHVSLVRRDLVGRLEARTDARFDPEPVHAEFLYA